MCDIANRLCLLEGAAVATTVGYATASDATTNGGIKMMLQPMNAKTKIFVNKIKIPQRTNGTTIIFINKISMLERTQMLQRTKDTTNNFCQ